ncbi:MAG: formylglycine-generating enzyme family protein [Planctomyces sp.]
MSIVVIPAWAEESGEDEYGVYCRFRISDVWFVMRWIPPGEFTMGSPESDTGRDFDEGPQHRVVISQGFWLGETPVTQQQWRAVVQAAKASELPDSPSSFKDKPQHPVESVNWHQSVQFCQQVQAVLQSAQQFRLPTEAEWEYACRAGTSGAFHDGSPCTEPRGRDPALEHLGWFDENSNGSTQPVRQKKPNTRGLFDMHGNVWEWCRDGQRPYSAELQVDPVCSETSGASRVLRGGSWISYSRRGRAAYRYTYAPGNGWYTTGLRLSAGPGAQSGGACAERVARAET